ncbi:MAG: methylenetetrahydrofolate reductase [Clostridiales bacterium]|jgi:methylenetetrahydrofolate reductase (NADPH)|nr:methylenetetrahydrofolate reductase [Clostridiales bacterium]
MSVNKLFSEAILDREKLSITWELVPGRGAVEKSQEHVLKMAALAAKDPVINGITITDNPGGKPAILAYTLAVEVKKLGIEPIIHFTCKDKNRNDIESELYALARSEIHNLLVMTGDYPSEGYAGRPKPVFDIDSVQALKLIGQLNEGEDIPSYKGRVTLQATNFFAGAVVSPFKKTEAELMAQYYKLNKKVDAGAKFIITQLGYDVRKFDELRKYMDINKLNVPLIGNIFMLSLPVAKMMYRNEIPGCIVTSDLLKALEEDKGKSSNQKELQLQRCADLYAVLKGLKYQGVNISGHGLDYDDIRYIIEKGEELSPNWRDIVEKFSFPQKDEFYFFEKDRATGLNIDKPIDVAKSEPGKFSFGNFGFSLIHKTFFEEKSPLYPIVKKGAQFIDKSFLKRPFTYFEYVVKTATNECHSCGDCAMHELGFICPMSKCPKQQRNGACGGSFNGWCEVYPGKQKCIYVTMYQNFKASNKQDKMKEGYIPPCNWDLYRTSSWLNYFNGRDYTSSIKTHFF